MCVISIIVHSDVTEYDVSIYTVHIVIKFSVWNQNLKNHGIELDFLKILES